MKPRTGRESGVETEQSDRQGEQKQRCNQEYRQSKATGRVKKREVHTDMRTERERECACVCMRERKRETEQEARRQRCTGVTDPEPRSDDETLDGVVSEERVGGARERESEGSP